MASKYPEDTSQGVPSNTDKLDSTDIKVLADNIAQHLLPLAWELDLSMTKQADLQTGPEDLTQKVHKMIYWWQQRKRNQATKSALITALRKIRRNDLADMLSTTQTTIDRTKFTEEMAKV